MGFRELTGGFELRKLEEVSATDVSGLMQERDSDQFAHFELVVPDAEPHEFVYLILEAVPRPAEFAIERLSEGEAIEVSRPSWTSTPLRTGSAARCWSRRTARYSSARPYGLADREQLPNTLDTRFRIGSMNKMFTAVAILQLVEAGKIELDAPLGEYLNDYPNEDVAAKVTIHHLLTHTGGTGDIFGPAFELNRRSCTNAR